VYLKERYIAVDTPVGQLGDTVRPAGGSSMFQEKHSEKLCKYCRIYL